MQSLACVKSARIKLSVLNMEMLKHFVLAIPKDIFFAEVALVKYLQESHKQLLPLQTLAMQKGYDSLAEFLHDDSEVVCWDFGTICILFWPDSYGLSLDEDDGILFYDEY